MLKVSLRFKRFSTLALLINDLLRSCLFARSMLIKKQSQSIVIKLAYNECFPRTNDPKKRLTTYYVNSKSIKARGLINIELEPTSFNMKTLSNPLCQFITASYS